MEVHLGRAHSEEYECRLWDYNTWVHMPPLACEIISENWPSTHQGLQVSGQFVNIAFVKGIAH